MKMETPEEKLMMLKINKDIEKMNKSNLNYLKNTQKRILKRVEEIEYLDALYNPAPIMSNKYIQSTFSNQLYHTKSSFYKKESKSKNKNKKLPRLNTNPNFRTLDTYKRTKKYKVVLKKKRDVLSEEKIKQFLGQSGFEYIPSKLKFEKEEKIKFKENENNNNNNGITKTITNGKNKRRKSSVFEKRNSNLNDDKINIKRVKSLLDRRKAFKKKNKSKKLNFEYYLKMQSRAEIKLKPKIGDESKDLVNYIRAIQGIRETLITDILEEINKTENRYNIERPEVDAHFVVKNKGLNIHKWKNLFYLKDYQKFFLEGLKGKISNGNYKQMEKKFRQIQHACFSEGRMHFNNVKNIKFSE
jgi:hypothetical protein